MEQFLVFIGSNPILSGAFAVVLAALIATESARFVRKWKELDTQQAILLMNRQEPLILDASNSADYAKGHILGALHMPPSALEAGNKELMKSVERPVLVYCKNGQVSPQMASRLTKMGFEQVYVLKGGLINWIADKQPVSRGKAAKKSDNSKDKKKKSKNKTKQQPESAAVDPVDTEQASVEANTEPAKISGDDSADIDKK